MQVHQLLAGATPGDAITEYALAIQKIFLAEGIPSDLYAPMEHVNARYARGTFRSAGALPREASENDIVCYHYSIGSKASENYRQTLCRKALCYHNITPPRYFLACNSGQAEQLQAGRDSLPLLAAETHLAMAVSHYNARELEEAGYKNVAVVPLLAERPGLFQHKPRAFTEFKDGKTNWLFVGRVVPNKRFEDIIRAFAWYHKTINPHSRLVLAGTHTGNELYVTYLKSLLFNLELTEAVRLTGHIADGELALCYQAASAFICLSEHEGFGLPLIEAMQFGVPVFALDRAAVAETLGGAGVCIETLDHRRIAELVHAVLRDPAKVVKIRERQRERTQAFTRQALRDRLLELFRQYFQLPAAV